MKSIQSQILSFSLLGRECIALYKITLKIAYMQLFWPSWLTAVCVCHNCKHELHYIPREHNIYSGGPFYCGNCNVNVTEDIYGKKKETKIS